MATYGNLIGGRWVPAASGQTFSSFDPAEPAEAVGVVPRSAGADVEAAVAAARAAFPAWARTPAPRRGEILFAAAEILARRKRELGETVTREMGKVLAEGLGDAQEAIDMTYYMAGEGRRLAGETVPSELPDKDARSVRVPLGIIALITPWNFPLAIPAWKIAPALIAGNTVVVKPSNLTPVCATRLAEVFQEAGLPPGVLNVVHGLGAEIGESLVRHPGVTAVSFTGSSAVGDSLGAVCGALHKPCMTETGGKNPIIVMDDADLDLAVEGCLWGGFGTTGQRCTAASRVIVHETVFQAFLARFVDRTRRLRVGPGSSPDVEVGPLASRQQLDRVLEYVRIGLAEGARLVCGGQTFTDGPLSRGCFMAPAIFTEVAPGMRIAQEEIFGPVVAVIRVAGFPEAIAVANDVPYGLSAAIYTRDVDRAARAERDLDAGIVYVNTATIGAEIQLPFGGTKRTGIGPREAGGRGGALDFYTKWKVIYRDFSGRLQKAQIDR